MHYTERVFMRMRKSIGGRSAILVGVFMSFTSHFAGN